MSGPKKEKIPDLIFRLSEKKLCQKGTNQKFSSRLQFFKIQGWQLDLNFRWHSLVISTRGGGKLFRFGGSIFLASFQTFKSLNSDCNSQLLTLLFDGKNFM